MLAAAAAMGTAALCGSAMAVSAAGEMNWDDSAVYQISGEDEVNGTLPGSYAFYYGESYPEKLEIPEVIHGLRIIEIAHRAFDGCENVREIVIPDGTKRIEDNAFPFEERGEEAYGITVTIPASVEYIGYDFLGEQTGAGPAVNQYEEDRSLRRIMIDYCYEIGKYENWVERAQKFGYEVGHVV